MKSFSQNVTLNAYHLGEIMQKIYQVLETEENISINNSFFIFKEGIFKLNKSDLNYFENKIEFINNENTKNLSYKEFELIVHVKEKKNNDGVLELLINFQTKRSNEQILGTYLIHYITINNAHYPNFSEIYYSKFTID